MGNIIVANSDEEIQQSIINYDTICYDLNNNNDSNNLNFCKKLDKVIESIF